MRSELALHIHFKDGKFAIWSTIVDAYVTDWSEDEDFIIAEWLGSMIYLELAIVKRQIESAKKNGCSAGLPARHSREEI